MVQSSQSQPNNPRDEAVGSMNAVAIDPAAIAQLQQEYVARFAGLMNEASLPAAKDARFATDAWRQTPFAFGAAFYELNAEFLSRMADALHGDPKSVHRAQFAISQWIDAMSPANFLLTNPLAQEKMRDSGGQSLQLGMQNLMADLSRGRISQTDEAAFGVGDNLAVTPGHVVFENELIQLIQYTPVTDRVYRTPMLMVPPCINKFYILDLQPHNSVVAHLVEQGHTVFMLSWRNVKADQGHLGWDDYLETGVCEAIEQVRQICGVRRINALGFCVGGTIIATTLAALAARGESPVKSLTLLTTLLDFDQAGVLDIFVDEAHVALREGSIGRGGILTAAELSQTFSSLRPNDLIWNYVVRNYLYGEQPPAFDLLYWNSDGTNLPGPFFVWYLRHTYLQNELSQPDRLRCMGQAIDLARIDVPTYIYGSRDDHIVPWHGAYASTKLLSGDLRFVLGASGHIAGVINPPAKNKRQYWTNEDLPDDPEQWLDQASENAGSWWPDWIDWLDQYSGKKVKAPKKPGNADHPAIEPAPGRYVCERA